MTQKSFTAEQFKNIGHQLLKLRTANHLSAATVAREALGYENGSHVAVTRLENGILSQPKIEHINALLAYYQTTWEFLLSTNEPVDLPAPAPAPQLATKTSEPSPLAPFKPKMRPAPKGVGPRIQWAREQLQLSEEDFAWAIRKQGPLVTSLDVQAWEAGERRPNPIQFRALALACERTEAWFDELEAATRKPASNSVWGFPST